MVETIKLMITTLVRDHKVNRLFQNYLMSALSPKLRSTNQSKELCPTLDLHRTMETRGELEVKYREESTSCRDTTIINAYKIKKS